ncbi:Predicted arabinose efflux permease, MFS family [Agromyces sp. CF514]|uniref:MFS transporter n=1 Tax=Agromyces sp. CF514 TaxID=1881031 RepID=UPI0008EDBB29|nr:MFS transporter [Agromyces sp. CF514]SFR68610.1 Predicted arabinose efflux permease, MFS family [Agromyces sp. CF514]
MFRSLAGRNYRLWFIGAIVSNVGGWMQSTTQDWVVLTEMTDNNAAAVGTTMALQFGPQLLLVPITGAVIDRFDRRKVLLVTQTVLMLLAFGLGLLLLAGHAELWHLYAFALAFGITSAFDAPARQTFVSDLVSGPNASNAVALNAASFNVARLIGPAVAGGLIVLVGSGWVFLINGVTFLALIGALLAMRERELIRHPRRPREGNALVQGFRYVAGRSDLVVVMTIVFLVGAFAMNFPIFSSTMAVMFGEGAGEYGILSSILAIGSLTAALLAARRSRARLRVVVISVGALGVAMVVASLMPTYATFAASTVFIGFCTVTLLTTANGYVQTTTDASVRGRVMALYTAVLMGSTLVGAPIVGWVADAAGPRWALGAGALASFVSLGIGVGWLVVARGLRITRVPQRPWRFGVAWAAATDAIADGDRVALPTGAVAVVEAGPEDFSDEVAMTSPIPLPKLPVSRTDAAGRASENSGRASWAAGQNAAEVADRAEAADRTPDTADSRSRR